MESPPTIVHITFSAGGDVESVVISARWREQLENSGARLAVEVLTAYWRATSSPPPKPVRVFDQEWMANAADLARGDFSDRVLRHWEAVKAASRDVPATRELTTERCEIRGSALGNHLVSLEFDPVWLRRVPLNSLSDRLVHFLDQTRDRERAGMVDHVADEAAQLVDEMCDLLSERG